MLLSLVLSLEYNWLEQSYVYPWILILFRIITDCYHIKGKNTCSKAANIWKRYWYKGRAVMVWPGLILNGCFDLHILISATVNAEIYRDEILGLHFKLSMDEIWRFWIVWLLMVFMKTVCILEWRWIVLPLSYIYWHSTYIWPTWINTKM